MLYNRIKQRGIFGTFKTVFYTIGFRVIKKIDEFNESNNESNSEGEIVINDKIIDSDSLYSNYLKYCVLSLDEEIIERGNNILNNNIVLFGKTFQIDIDEWLTDPISGNKWDSEVYCLNAPVEYQNLGDVKYVMELNKMYHLVDLAKAYHVSKDERFLKGIERALKSWQTHVHPKKSVVNRIALDRAFRCFNLLHVCFLCQENLFFRNEILGSILKVLIIEEKRIRLFSTPRWHKFNDGANHSIGEMIGLISTQKLISYYTGKNYKKEIKWEYEKLNEALEKILTKKGVYLEQSSAYSKLTYEFLVLLDIFFKIFPSKLTLRFDESKYLKNLYQYLKLLHIDGKLLDFGDNDGAKVLYPFYDHLKPTNISGILKYCDNKFAENDVKMTHLYCCESGQFIFKDKRLHCFIRCGKHSYFPIGSSSHSHNDILSLLLSINDNEVFIDQGTYLYNSGIALRNSDRSTSVHNTISFEEIEQAEFFGKWSFIKFPESKVIDHYLKKDGFSYAGQCYYNGNTHTRILDYEADSNVFTIKDQLISEYGKIAVLSFLLHPDILLKSKDKLINSYGLYKGESFIATIQFDGELKIEIEDVLYNPAYGVKECTSRIIAKISTNQIKELVTTIHIHE